MRSNRFRVAFLVLLIAQLACRAGGANPIPTLQATTPASQDSESSRPGWHELSLSVSGIERWFRVYVPAALPQEAAVVVLLHGGTQSMRKIFYQQAGGSRAWLDVADENGILLVVPNGTNPDTGETRGDRQNWNDLRLEGSARNSNADDVGFIAALLDWTGRTYPIDPARIYVTGASNGGMMTYRLLIEIPERFAAGVAFIASLPEEASALNQPALPTPLMIANGTADPLVKWEGGEITGRGGRVMSAEANLAWWVAADHTDAQAAVTTALPDPDPNDGCRIYQTVYPARSDGAPVVFYKIEGGGHSMPSIRYEIPDNILVDELIGPVCHDAEGAPLAWDFMKDKRR